MQIKYKPKEDNSETRELNVIDLVVMLDEEVTDKMVDKWCNHMVHLFNDRFVNPDPGKIS